METFAAGRDGEDDPEFREGVPQVLVPMGADQLDNTARAAAAGTARVLTIEGLRPEVVREAVREVLSDPGYRSHARRLQAEMEVLPPVEYGVALLEGLATGSASAGPIPDAHSHESTDEGARAR